MRGFGEVQTAPVEVFAERVAEEFCPEPAPASALL
jgi:hypothetical protein